MNAPPLFCGVVTHPKSTYSTQEYEESFSGLRENPITSTFDFRFKIVKENHFGVRSVSLLAILMSSVNLKLIESRWSRYLSSRNTSFAQRLFNILKIFFLTSSRLLTPASRKEERIKALRIVNINWNHMRLMELGNSLACSGQLILEDDARFPGGEEFAQLLLDLHRISQSITNPLYFFDLSESYSLSELGAIHLVDEFFSIELQVGQRHHSLQHMKKAITNTVCSVFYSSALVRILEPKLKGSLNRNLEKYVPIDWLINLYLMQLKREGSEVLCFKSDPGIFEQQSFLARR